MIILMIMCLGDEVRHSSKFQALLLVVIVIFCFMQHMNLGCPLFRIITFGCLYVFPWLKILANNLIVIKAAALMHENMNSRTQR